MKSVHLVPVVDGPMVAAVETLARKIWPEHYIPLIGETQVAYMLEKFQTQKALLAQLNEGYLYYLIQNDQKTGIGYMAIQPREADLFLSKLYLLAETRGKGYSRPLLEWLQSFAQEKGLSKITLTVHKRNPSVEIYRKLGFRIIGPVVTDIGNGFVMDDYRMEFAL
jgi:diamine N-acetyltransferase